VDAENGTGEERFDSGAVGRRVAQRRTQLGLSEGALATRVSMSPHYLRQVLGEGPGFDRGGLLRIAAALGLTYEELLEGRRDMPPGQTPPAPHPVLARLSEAECWDRLGTHGVGRVALPVRPGPAVLPVNYTVEAHSIVYRTVPGGSAAPETGTEMSFQADHLDDRLSQGWSVLITGTAERVEDAGTVRRLTDRHAAEPWAGGHRTLWIRVRPQRVTGRRITTV
jgi:nitroimidazol reductase NimA-like FMN-containing flavoprotein (pyridoxamine 5'-phosphate oxidase superfamily)